MRTLSAAVLVALALAAHSAAEPGGRGRGRGGDDDASVSVSVGVVFGREAELEIRGYFGDHPVAPQSLPPGIARNLARGKPLPPGIAKRYPPADLLGRLPSYPDCEIVLAGGDVLLVSLSTGIVLDILENVLR